MLTKRIAKVLTYTLNPLLMPALGVLMIFNSGTYLSYVPEEGKKFVLIVVLAGTFLLPLCLLPLYLYFNVVKNIEMDDHSERMVPLLITSIFYFFTFIIMRHFPVSFVNTFILASALCVILNMFINLKWKISSHLIGAGGLTGLTAALYFRLNADMTNLLILSLLIAGVLGFARLKLNAHTPAQIYAGFFLGFTIVTASILIY